VGSDSWEYKRKSNWDLKATGGSRNQKTIVRPLRRQELIQAMLEGQLEDERKKETRRESARLLCDWKANHKRQVPISSKLYLFLSLTHIIIFICELHAVCYDRREWLSCYFKSETELAVAVKLQ